MGRKRLFLLIIVLIVLIVLSFSMVYIFLITHDVPEAGDFCNTWGALTCQQVGTLSENWGIELELRENGVVVKKSCLNVLECESCQDCGFL
ncbi:MAG: hypothetical protein JSW41_01815 [Candidatus Aenigmatarchaeota archaeon]|nr:MAG: hypothetical protein JSW41_01815 [Candidatus Aenigmarchaeota archaeon]